MPLSPQLLLIAILLLLAVLAAKVSDRFGVPALLLFMLIGMAVGSDGPGGIVFDDAELASQVGSIALAFILFSGGLDTRWNAVRRVLLPGITLATWGTLITALVTGLAAVLIFDMSLPLGLLVGAIVSSTDAAAVFSVLRSKGVGLRGRLRPLLELESASNDPMAVFLTIGFVAMVTTPETAAGGLVWLFIRQMAVGTVIGISVAWIATRLLNHIRLGYDGLYPVLTVAFVLLIFGVTDVFGGSGFLAVYLAGITVSRQRLVHKRSLVRFHDGVGWLMQITMFLLLGLLVFPSRLPEVALQGLALSAVLMLLARPLGVALSVVGGDWSVRDRLLVSWVGLRGAVPIILATFALAEGIERADTIFDAVFFVVLLSVALQGTTISFAARRLGVDAPAEGSSGDREEIAGGGATGRRMSDIVVHPDSWTVGRQVVELDLPPGSWLVLLTRGETVLVPQGPTVLQGEDRLTVLANAPEKRLVEQIIRSQARRRSFPGRDTDRPSAPQESGRYAPVSTGGATMFTDIILPVSDKPDSAAVLPRATVLAEQLACPLTLLTAAQDADRIEAGHRLLDDLMPEIPASVSVRSIVEADDPATAILATAAGTERPLIAMSTSAARPLREVLFGSVTQRVLREGGHPMMVTGPACRPIERGEVDFRRLIVCIDGSIASLAILPLARYVAERTESSVLLLHVSYPLVDPAARDATLSSEDREIYDMLAKTAEEWAASGIDVEWSVDRGTWPPETIVKGIVRREADLVAMATHGRTALARLLTGSVTSQVIKTSPVPVLTVRPTALLH